MDRLITNHVPPSGPAEAKILILGEAPGEEEDHRLTPFVGSSGQLLDQCLKVAGLARRDVLTSNCFQQRPPKNKIDHYFQDKTAHNLLTWEGEEHIERLRLWLTELLEARESGFGGPNVIAALGAVPLKLLTGKKRITKWRGSVLPCTLVPGFKVYPAFHPSYVNRLMNEPSEKIQGEKKKDQQNVLPIFIRDLERIGVQSDSPVFQRPERTFTIADNSEGAISYLNKLIEDADKGKKILLACDIETLPSSRGPIVWCIGFSESPEVATCIPILKNQSFHWSSKQETLIWRLISKVFLHPSIRIVFHNGFYDMSVLGRYYGLRVSEGTYEDTMYGHQMNYPYLRKNLALCTSIYTWEPYYKDDGKVHAGKRISDYEEFIYNCRDCAVTREIFPQIARDARELGMEKNYSTSMEVFPSLLHMQIRGVAMDEEKKKHLTELFKNRSTEYEETIKSLIGRDINLRSSPQLIKLLYVEMNCATQYAHKTGKPTTDKDAINRLLIKYQEPSSSKHKVLKNLALFRRYSKLSDTYTKMELDHDGRIRTSYGWVTTFRLNSSASHFGGGGNLQNIPVRTEAGKEIRRLFIPDDGKIFVACDLAQAEAREVAYLAHDTRMIRLFAEGWDVHWARTKSIFNFSDDLKYEPAREISDAYTGLAHTMKFYRGLGKTIVHAGNYMMGAGTLQNILAREEVNLSLMVCRKLLQSNKNSNPLLIRWQNNTIEEIKGTRTLTNALGDKRIFRGRLNSALYRSAISFRPQSVVGRILQIAINNIHKEMQPQFEVLLNIHDEVIGQCYEKDLPEVIVGIKERIEIPHQVGGRELIIPSDFKIGYNWGDLKEIEV